MIRARGVEYAAGSFRLSLDLDVRPGEHFVLMGPTGSGKTASLECIAGLRPIDSGVIEIAGRDVTRAEPSGRGVAYVPQDKVLFPHLSVFENIAFPLRVRRVESGRAAAEVSRVAGTLGIAPLLNRAVEGLSGGESQRVALARALVAGAKVLLLDEPVSALDGETRDGILDEVERIHAGGVTILHACHSVEEMERVADRVGLMRSGRLVQAGTPQELTARPADAWVARALRLGSVLAAEARPQGGGGVLLDFGGFSLTAAGDAASAGRVEVLIRPWGVHLAPEGAAADSFAAKVVRVTPRGPGATADFAVGGARLRAELSDGAPAASLAAGETVRLQVDPAAVTVFGPSQP